MSEFNHDMILSYNADRFYNHYRNDESQSLTEVVEKYWNQYNYVDEKNNDSLDYFNIFWIMQFNNNTILSADLLYNVQKQKRISENFFV